MRVHFAAWNARPTLTLVEFGMARATVFGAIAKPFAMQQLGPGTRRGRERERGARRGPGHPARTHKQELDPRLRACPDVCAMTPSKHVPRASPGFEHLSCSRQSGLALGLDAGTGAAGPSDNGEGGAVLLTRATALRPRISAHKQERTRNVELGARMLALWIRVQCVPSKSHCYCDTTGMSTASGHGRARNLAC